MRKSILLLSMLVFVLGGLTSASARMGQGGGQGMRGGPGMQYAQGAQGQGARNVQGTPQGRMQAAGPRVNQATRQGTTGQRMGRGSGAANNPNCPFY